MKSVYAYNANVQAMVDAGEVSQDRAPWADQNTATQDLNTMIRRNGVPWSGPMPGEEGLHGGSGTPTAASAALSGPTGADAVLNPRRSPGNIVNGPVAGSTSPVATASFSSPSLASLAQSPTDQPNVSGALADARTIEANAAATQSSFRNPALASTAAAPTVPAIASRYASGSNFDTNRATNDFAAGKITQDQLNQVNAAASTVGNTQTTRPMSATDAANAAAERLHPSAPPGALQYGKIGQVDVPIDQQPSAVRTLGGTTVLPNGASVTVGGGPAPRIAAPGQPTLSGPTGDGAPGAKTGIFVDGQSVTHGAVDPTTGQPSLVATQPANYMTRQEAINAVVASYPAIGIAGTPQNTQFLKSYQEGNVEGGAQQNGGDYTSALNLAHSLFAPKTQAGTLAAAKARGLTDDAAAKTAGTADRANAQQQVNTAAAMDRAATLAARTPAQVSADAAKQTANQAAVANAGKSVYDPGATATNVGRVIGDAASFTPQDVYDDDLAPAVGAVKNLFTGLSGSPTSAAPVATPSATPGVSTSPTRLGSTALPATPSSAPAPAPASASSTSPASAFPVAASPVPASTDPNDNTPSVQMARYVAAPGATSPSPTATPAQAPAPSGSSPAPVTAPTPNNPALAATAAAPAPVKPPPTPGSTSTPAPNVPGAPSSTSQGIPAAGLPQDHIAALTQGPSATHDLVLMPKQQ